MSILFPPSIYKLLSSMAEVKIYIKIIIFQCLGLRCEGQMHLLNYQYTSSEYAFREEKFARQTSACNRLQRREIKIEFVNCYRIRIRLQV